jgi:NAD(P)H-dependent FMN reductase
MKVEVIIASTRPGRIGDQIGAWIAGYATEHTAFDVAIADLAEINLPMFDEPGHPRLGVCIMNGNISLQVLLAMAVLVPCVQFRPRSFY